MPGLYDQETIRYINESERDRGVPVVAVDALLGTFGIEERQHSRIEIQKRSFVSLITSLGHLTVSCF